MLIHLFNYLKKSPMKKLQNTLIMGLLHLLLFTPIIGYSQGTREIDYTDDSNFPKGKLGVVVQNFINAVNQNDSSKVREFIENFCAKSFQDMFPMEMHQEFFLGVYQQTGGLSFYSIRSYPPPAPENAVHIVFKDKKYNLWHETYIGFEDNKDYLIKALSYYDARIPSSVYESKIAESELGEKVNETIDRLCKKDIFSGTVLIAKGEKVVYTKACGEASKRFHVANNLDTKFNLGSMNKMFTATAIMQLVEKGIVKLDDPISKYVDESWLPKSMTDKITVHHLLSHTSGLGSYFNDTYWNGSRELYRTVDDFKPLVKGDTIAFDPGARFQYSNTGMLLLGVVIQKATGEDYFEYIRQNIYEPAGMKNSDSYEMDQPVENLAIGYIPVSSNKYGWENNLYKHVIKGGPAGGGFSTVGDLHSFALALTNEKLVSKSSLDLLWTDYTKSPYGYGYGYGFNVYLSLLGKVVGHAGGFEGLNSKIDIMLDKGYIVVVMSNYSSGANPVANIISHLISRLKD